MKSVRVVAMFVLMVLNAFFLFYAMYLVVVEPEFTRLEASMRYTALDRAEVIDRKKLAEFDPDFANNDRGKVPRWIVNDAWVAQRRNAALVAALAGINLAATAITLAFDWLSHRREVRRKMERLLYG